MNSPHEPMLRCHVADLSGNPREPLLLWSHTRHQNDIYAVRGMRIPLDLAYTGLRQNGQKALAMLITAITAFLLGAALAQRFKIHILIPLVGFAGAAIFVQLLVSAAEGWHLAMMMATALAGLQIGYLAGAAFRSWEIFHLKDQQRDSEKPEADNESLPIN